MMTSWFDVKIFKELNKLSVENVSEYVDLE